MAREGVYGPFRGLKLAIYELVMYQGLHSAMYIGMSHFLDSRKGLKILENMSKVRWLVRL